MSYQLSWCEHRYNADRKPRQSLVEPIMGRAVGAGLQTPLFLCRATLRYMINFLTNSTQAAWSLPSLQVAKLVSCGTAWLTPGYRAKHKVDQKGSFLCFFLLLTVLPHTLAFNGSFLRIFLTIWLSFTVLLSLGKCRLQAFLKATEALRSTLESGGIQIDPS